MKKLAFLAVIIAVFAMTFCFATENLITAAPVEETVENVTPTEEVVDGTPVVEDTTVTDGAEIVEDGSEVVENEEPTFSDLETSETIDEEPVKKSGTIVGALIAIVIVVVVVALAALIQKK